MERGTNTLDELGTRHGYGIMHGWNQKELDAIMSVPLKSQVPRAHAKTDKKE